MDNNIWEEIKSFYKNEFDIEPELVEVMACMEVLAICVSGYSNEAIAKALDMEVNDVKTCIKTYLRFDGFENSLTVSPILVYTTGEEAEKTLLFAIYPELETALKLYVMLKELLDEQWK